MAWPILAGFALTAAAAAPDQSDLQNYSIEDLTHLTVTSAGKREEPLSQAPAALYVITNQDILRQGATSLPEVLRLAPNLDVQRVDARQYAITARGFQGYETANKLLVQIDGRSIYSTLSDSVFWDLFDTPLEDIDRIEVISGPGGTLYGANAVNGVINITTKDARDTIGVLARGTAGNLEQTGLIRYGAPVGANGAIRVYAEGWNRQGFPASGGRDLRDGGEGWQAGLRSDFGSGSDQFTLQGDVFQHYYDSGAEDGDDGQNILARWTHAHDDGAQTEVQGYYSRFARRFFLVFDRLATTDLSVQHNRTEGRHAIVVGAGARMIADKFVNDLNQFQLVPQSKTLWIYNAFAQDRVDLGGGVAVTAGLKLEKTTFTGVEVLPSVRLAWQPTPGHLLYASAARALREPSRIDRDLTAIDPRTGLKFLEGGMFQAEKLTALEIGYRGQPVRSVSFSVAAFYNLYDDLRSTEITPVTTFPVRLANGIKGHSWGIEAWANAQLTDWWRLSAGIATLDKNFHLKPGATDIQNFISLGNDPDYNLQLGSRFDFTPSLGLDVQVRRYGSRPNPHVPAYTDADARLGWRVSPAVELYLAGSNLLHDERPESEDVSRGQLVHRIVYLGARFGF
ncbi:TonB-dependent receptor plug domain-containing protein [Sphingomonas horti]|uniref:TonB-dependent receptor plug domain-containing protein n=1 Tax=Sphingomonas horti TaxID=2682842 RepID=UPI00180D52D6|nr:TonB-dependent receptor [Sphingomonas horti]MBA2920454.1 TonB-dependent receptor [Sphingomonas sp. CGMCC 1.13658]